jgi:hypothetical protein
VSLKGQVLSKRHCFHVQVRLLDVTNVELVERRGYLTLGLRLKGREGRVLFRRSEGLTDWYLSISTSCKETKVGLKGKSRKKVYETMTWDGSFGLNLDSLTVFTILSRPFKNKQGGSRYKTDFLLFANVAINYYVEQR